MNPNYGNLVKIILTLLLSKILKIENIFFSIFRHFFNLNKQLWKIHRKSCLQEKKNLKASVVYGFSLKSLMSYIDRPLIIIVIQADSTRISGTTTIIKKSSKCKFEKSMKRFSIVQMFIGLIRFG